MHNELWIDDFDELWSTLRERYCFFAEKQTDWMRVRDLYRPLAMQARTTETLQEIVRRVLLELYDAHTHLSHPVDGTPHNPFWGMLVERDGGAARVTAIEPGSEIARAGLVIDDRILSVDGTTIGNAASRFRPRCLAAPDPAADNYALNVAVAGLRGQGRRFVVASKGAAPRPIVVPAAPEETLPDVDWRRLDHGLGYIVIRSFVDANVVDAFDRALATLRDTAGLIIDVTDNGGGDTAVASPIMGRFIRDAKPYAIMRRREGVGLSAPWTESIEPRGPFTYTAPVVVLASHWSGSMAEGFPMGMRDIGRATVVGTRMMGLGAAVFELRLDRTGIDAQYSAEPVYDTRGRPRWNMEPDVRVSDGEDMLAAGIAVLASAARI